jgi:UDP-GlcNAc:undecaprenyl-phosphate/decaprenyl-phosphate GlcNAc-1-phosphate transferase
MSRRYGTAARAAMTAGAAAAMARASYAVLRRWPPGGAARWTRTNHRGEPVTLLEGPAVALGAAAASAFAPGLPARGRAALVAGGAGAAAFGAYDDLAGGGGRRGFRGHLAALAGGEVTTGVVKIAGIGAAAAAAAVLAGGPPADVLINAGLTAGGANLLNLFDLRPGRAIKVALASGALVTGLGGPGSAGAVAGPAGAALALLGDDLGERAMLGDLGANALGAMLGAAAAVTLSRPARGALLAGIVGLTAASEVVSFTAVIERTPALRWLDMLGRRPAGGPPAGLTGPDASSAAADGRRQAPVTGEVQGAGPTSGAVAP